MSWELHLAGAASLKDKRSVIKSMKDRLHNEFNVSVAETGHHDAWQRAEVTACVVSAERRHAESVVAAVDRFVAASSGCRIIDSATTYL
ncbi:MAG: DUF503 domain-containing protein [Gemmatimonadaceae bacterium]